MLSVVDRPDPFRHPSRRELGQPRASRPRGRRPADGQVIGRSDTGGAHPASEPYRPEHLLSTVMRTLFDPGEVRLRTELPSELVKAISEGEPIRELF